MRRVLLLALLLAAPAGAAPLPDELLEALRDGAARQAERDAARLALVEEAVAAAQDRLARTRRRLAREDGVNEELRRRLAANDDALEDMRELLADQRYELSDLGAAHRETRRALRAVLGASLVSAQRPQRLATLDGPAPGEAVPGLASLRTIWTLMLEELTENGRVQRFRGEVQEADGERSDRRIVRVGTFTATDGDRFLAWSAERGILVPAGEGGGRARSEASALAAASSRRVVVPIDPTGGALLRRALAAPGPLSRLRAGGVIGLLIVAVGAAGAVVLVLATLRLLATRHRGERALQEACAAHRQAHGEAPRAWLQEAAARESERLRRGLAALRLVVGVAPLLGLLGTVTGMILTFRVLQVYGTGDATLMADGIGQALVTTALGLAVAVPLLIGQRWLAARAAAEERRLQRRATALASADREGA